MPKPAPVPRKYIGFFRLVDACDRPGCPVCRCLQTDSRQYLDSLLYEQVNDPDTRRRLHGSWGLCNWHTWMLREVSDPAFGTAILYEDFLRAAIERIERGADRVIGHARGLSGWLSRLGRRARRSLLTQMYRRRAVCPGCSLIAESETHYVRLALHFIEDPQFENAYSRSQGLCVPHVLQALDLAASAAQARQFVALTLPKWAELRRDLQGFIGKHDYRKRQPFTEAESVAYLRALEMLAGVPGLFGNDVGARPPGRESRERTIEPRSPIAMMPRRETGE
jgi:uncharacterized protein DUF6062